MKQCPKCGRWFKNKYSVRTHLASCPNKKNSGEK